MRTLCAAIVVAILVGPAKAGHYRRQAANDTGSVRLQADQDAGRRLHAAQISNSRKGAFEASLTSIGNQLVAAWYDTRDGHPEIYMRLLDDRGRPAGPERRITHGADADHAYEPDVAAANTDIAIAWYEQNQTTKQY